MLKATNPGSLIFVMPKSGTFTDPRDSKVYPWVRVGGQIWMAENLAYLPSVNPSNDGSTSTARYYVYGYEGTSVSAAKATANFTTYGALYNYPASLTACPSGWHMPTHAEWAAFTDYLTNNGFGYGGSGSDIGKSLASTSGWTSGATAGTIGNNQAGNNSTGFSARPGGYRYKDGYYYDLSGYAFFWTATESDAAFAWIRRLHYASDAVFEGLYPRGSGFSVRCLRN
jgi:uncharacterized protein (TIGR02145 family)